MALIISLMLLRKLRHMMEMYDFYSATACFASQEGVNERDIDPILMGMASQKAEREDTTITPDLRGK